MNVNDLKDKTENELVAMLREPWERTAAVITITMEARIRLHECQYHSRADQEGIEKLLCECNQKLREMFGDLGANWR